MQIALQSSATSLSTGRYSYSIAVTANYPETNDTLVTCTAVNGSNQCTAWTIFPITQAGGAVQNVARLQQK